MRAGSGGFGLTVSVTRSDAVPGGVAPGSAVPASVAPGSAAPAGIVLAAGAGTRMGRPKALVVENGTAWVATATALLSDSGCSPVIVVLGASAERARVLVPGFARVVIAENWESGMSASLRAGLAAAVQTDAASALITLVDLPRLPLAATLRVLEQPVRLRQATWGGTPGHPVLIPRAHWAPLADSLEGDAGARRYLAGHDVELVECGDLGDGSDVDSPAAVPARPQPPPRHPRLAATARTAASRASIAAATSTCRTDSSG